jgi:putative transcription antitermination factor YqgF
MDFPQKGLKSSSDKDFRHFQKVKLQPVQSIFTGRKFVHRLSKMLSLPVEYVDERLTSVEAENKLKAQKRFSTWNKGLIDQQAAQIILQQWLDQRRLGR